MKLFDVANNFFDNPTIEMFELEGRALKIELLTREILKEQRNIAREITKNMKTSDLLKVGKLDELGKALNLPFDAWFDRGKIGTKYNEQFEKIASNLVGSEKAKILKNKFDFQNLSGGFDKYNKFMELQYKESKLNLTDRSFRGKKVLSDIKSNFNMVDKQALRQIKNYNFSLIQNVSDDVRYGIKGALSRTGVMGEGVGGIGKTPETLDKTSQAILKEIPNKPMPVYKKTDLEAVQKGLKKIEDCKPLRSLSPEFRSRMIARTEMSRMHNQGNLNRYLEDGVDRVRAEHMDGECKDCASEINDMPKDGWLINEAPYFPLHPFAYEKNTQIFTSNGWKTIYNINNNDLIASINPETKLMEFIPYKNKIIRKNPFDYIYHIYNKWFDVKVSENHDVLVYERIMKDGKRIKVPKFVKPSKLKDEHYFLRNIENNNISPNIINVNGFEFKSKHFVQFIALYISEGSIRSKNTLKISCYINENKKIFKKILQEMNLNFKITKDGIIINNNNLVEYCKQFGYSHEKYLPKEIFKLSQSDLREFLNIYVMCDGHQRKTNFNSIENVIYTSSIKLVNDLSLIVNLAGFHPNINISSKKGTKTKHHNGEYTSKHDVYIIRMNKSNYTSLKNCKIEKIPYTDDIVCLELEKNHTLWIKSETGKTHWNGNCRHSYMPVITDDVYKQLLNRDINDLREFGSVSENWGTHKPDYGVNLEGFKNKNMENLINNTLTSLPESLQYNNFFKEGIITKGKNYNIVDNKHFEIPSNINDVNDVAFNVNKMYGETYYNLYKHDFPKVNTNDFGNGFATYIFAQNKLNHPTMDLVKINLLDDLERIVFFELINIFGI